MSNYGRIMGHSQSVFLLHLRGMKLESDPPTWGPPSAGPPSVSQNTRQVWIMKNHINKQNITNTRRKNGNMNLKVGPNKVEAPGTFLSME